MTSACEKCGLTFRKKDFGTDGDGHLILVHICERADIARFQQQHKRYDQMPRCLSAVYKCVDCQRRFIGTKVQLRCVDCGQAEKRRRDLARHAANRGAA